MNYAADKQSVRYRDTALARVRPLALLNPPKADLLSRREYVRDLRHMRVGERSNGVRSYPLVSLRVIHSLFSRVGFSLGCN